MPRTTARSTARLLIALFAALLIVAPTALTARADDGIAETYDFQGVLGPDGILKVDEVITFAKAPAQVEQRLATKAPVDRNRWYRYEITDVSAKIGDTDAGAEVSEDGDYLVVSVDTSKAGAQPVTISYRVRGTTRTDANSNDMRVFNWRVLQGLSVEVKETSGTLRVGGVPELVDCTAGPPGAIDKCPYYAAGTHEAPMPTFRTDALGAGEQVTFTVGVSPEATAETAELHESWSLDRAFSMELGPLLSALGALLLGGGLLYLLFRRTGIDEAHDGDVRAVGFFRPVGDGESVFEVPDDVRPGHVGTVADERVDPVDVTATILDLAVRGHLRIIELPRTQHGLLDWQLTRTSTNTDDLRPYEREILDAVAPEGRDTLVSELPATLAPVVASVQDALYDEVVERGWFDTRPDATRNSWRTRGRIGLVIAGIVALLLIMFTHLGLLAMVLMLLAAGLLWISERMPRRTAEGTRLVGGLAALSSLLSTHPTDQMPKGRELAEISKALPYAVVLGSRGRWMAAMVAADDDPELPDPTDISWYHAPQTWHLRDLPTSLSQFINTVQGQLFGR